jgi:hypothetical protein
VILLDEFVYIIFGGHPDCPFPSIPCDHPTLFIQRRGRGVLGTSQPLDVPRELME